MLPVRTLGVWLLTFPARASDPWTFPMIDTFFSLQECEAFRSECSEMEVGCLCGGRFVSFWNLDRRIIEARDGSVIERVSRRDLRSLLQQ